MGYAVMGNVLPPKSNMFGEGIYFDYILPGCTIMLTLSNVYGRDHMPEVNSLLPSVS